MYRLATVDRQWLYVVVIVQIQRLVRVVESSGYRGPRPPEFLDPYTKILVPP